MKKKKVEKILGKQLELLSEQCRLHLAQHNVGYACAINEQIVKTSALLIALSEDDISDNLKAAV